MLFKIISPSSSSHNPYAAAYAKISREKRGDRIQIAQVIFNHPDEEMMDLLVTSAQYRSAATGLRPINMEGALPELETLLRHTQNSNLVHADYFQTSLYDMVF